MLEKVEVGCEIVNLDPSGRHQPMEEIQQMGLKFHQHTNTDKQTQVQIQLQIQIQIQGTTLQVLVSKRCCFWNVFYKSVFCERLFGEELIDPKLFWPTLSGLSHLPSLVSLFVSMMINFIRLRQHEEYWLSFSEGDNIEYIHLGGA